jgi:hypothetical protein
MGLLVVTGLPGSNTCVVPRYLESQGWQILWPDQDLDLHGAKLRYKDGENPEVINLHNGILESAGKSWFTDCSPLFFDPPYPGPEDQKRLIEAKALFEHLAQGRGVMRRDDAVAHIDEESLVDLQGSLDIDTVGERDERLRPRRQIVRLLDTLQSEGRLLELLLDGLEQALELTDLGRESLGVGGVCCHARITLFGVSDEAKRLVSVRYLRTS